MIFIDRETNNNNRKKVTNIATGITEIVDVISEETVIKEGTAINAELLNKCNWREDDTISFKSISGNILPPAIADKTQIVTKKNGEVYIIPPNGTMSAYRIGNTASTLVPEENSMPTLLNYIYPIGSIYMSTSSNNPSIIFGGSWESWGDGRVPLSVNKGNFLFNESNKIGGSYDSIISQHNHNATVLNEDLTVAESGGATGFVQFAFVSSANGPYLEKAGIFSETAHLESFDGSAGAYANRTRTVKINCNIPNHKHQISAHNHTVLIGDTGQTATNANLSPYITCYMWRRTA